jgi:hypothetical protein
MLKAADKSLYLRTPLIAEIEELGWPLRRESGAAIQEASWA